MINVVAYIEDMGAANSSNDLVNICEISSLTTNAMIDSSTTCLSDISNVNTLQNTGSGDQFSSIYQDATATYTPKCLLSGSNTAQFYNNLQTQAQASQSASLVPSAGFFGDSTSNSFNVNIQNYIHTNIDVNSADTCLSEMASGNTITNTGNYDIFSNIKQGSVASTALNCINSTNNSAGVNTQITNSVAANQTAAQESVFEPLVTFATSVVGEFMIFMLFLIIIIVMAAVVYKKMKKPDIPPRPALPMPVRQMPVRQMPEPPSKPVQLPQPALPIQPMQRPVQPPSKPVQLPQPALPIQRPVQPPSKPVQRPQPVQLPQPALPIQPMQRPVQPPSKPVQRPVQPMQLVKIQ
jgi:hypothetical protein